MWDLKTGGDWRSKRTLLYTSKTRHTVSQLILRARMDFGMFRVWTRFQAEECETNPCDGKADDATESATNCWTVTLFSKND